MHIVDTTLFFSPTSGGVRRYLTAKHAWLAAHTRVRHTVLVPGAGVRYTPGEVCTLPGWLVPGTFNYRLALRPGRWARTLEALEPDLIEAGDAFHPAWCALEVAQRHGIPAVAFVHSNLPQLIGRRLGSLAERALGHYVRTLYSRFDAVFAPSRGMCAYLEGLGIPRVRHQPLGVDTSLFSPDRGRLDLRVLLDLPRDARLLVFAGRFAAEKNLPVLRAALARLGAPYHLVLIGGGVARRDGPRMTRVPYIRDPGEFAAWLASADALVHAGTEETFGLVVAEALACGIPVVAARAGALPELVDDSVGALAAPGDAASLAEAIDGLYARDREALGRAARARAVRELSWDHAFRLQLAAYARLSARAPRRLLTEPQYSG